MPSEEAERSGKGKTLRIVPSADDTYYDGGGLGSDLAYTVY